MTIAAGLIAPHGPLRAIPARLLLGAANAQAQAGPLTLFGLTLDPAQGEGMRVEVSRGWPDTTAYLSLIHGPNKDRLEAQIEAQKAQQQRQKAQRQSNAF